MESLEPVEREYNGVAKALHWLIFCLLAAQVAVGETMPDIGRNTLNEGLVAWHLSIGAAILFVIVLRLLWRMAYPVPLLPMISPWQKRLAQATHGILYLLVLAMTVLGWAAANYRGWDVQLFGVVTLPALAAKGTPWAHTAGDVHNFLVYVLLGVIGLHVSAALYHQFVKHDRVLQRMLPRALRSGSD